ncbi:response regulator transcription factor [Afipia sp. GAS231]|uniref:LuxR C-terminal-related transcriptional regulator n=1 Tax=Afipia sp. GAS231 TaxID=1882747 RepID=UPI001FCDAD50|nr:response regulator transcription factor [Afipia sp. GAS231]
MIADRHPVVLRGLSSVLGDHPDFNIVACCSDGASCIEALRNFAPDIAILDVSMPDVSFLDILSVVNSENLPTRLIVFTASDQELGPLLAGAADGYSVILKDVTPEVLVRSLREVAAGQRLLALPSSQQAASREQSTIAENALAALTDREQQIMRLVSVGLSNKEIGRRLNITDGTIKVHLHHIFQKLEITNRTVLAALAISLNDRASPSEDKPEQPIWSD